MNVRDMITVLLDFDMEDDIVVSNINTSDVDDEGDGVVQITSNDDGTVKIEYNGATPENEDLEATG